MTEVRFINPEFPCTRCDSEVKHTNEEHMKMFPVNTINEWMLSYGSNMDNHSYTLAGRGKFVKVGRPDTVIFRTQQEIYRFCAHLMAQAVLLPHEEGEHTFEEVQHAIHNA